MYLEYCTTKLGNFGDDLNPWMFPQLMPKAFEDPNDRIAFLGIGTILDQKRVERENLGANKANIVFSSGAGFGAKPQLNSSWHVYCVRGHHTARQLGVGEDKVIADGAYLLRTLINFKNTEKKYKLAFIPHHRSEDYTDWSKICEQSGVQFISMRQPVEQVLQQMLEAETIITEAMHGAIVADALRIPWIPVSYSPKFMVEKWLDFSGALNLDLNVNALPFYVHTPLSVSQSIEHSLKRGVSKIGLGPMKWRRLPNAYRKANQAQIDELCERLLSVANHHQVHQSSDTVVERITQQLSEKLDLVCSDYVKGKFSD